MARQLVINKGIKTSQLPAQTQQQMMTNLGKAIADGIAAQGVYNGQQPGEDMYDNQPMPNSMNYTITSAAGSGAATKTAYIFNEDVFNETPTTNGSASNSIVTTYGDGFSGHWYNQMIKTYNNGNGAMIYGWTVQAFQISTGNQDPTIYSTLNFSWAPYNGYGFPQTQTNDFNQAIRNTQYQDGIFTVKFKMLIRAIGQFAFVIPPDTKLVFTFLNKPFTT